MDQSVFTLDPSSSGDGGRRATASATIFFLFAFQAWLIARLRRCGDALVEAPTGAGKTLIIRTLVALDLGQANGFDRVIIASPQEQIERSFLHDRETIIRWPDGVSVQPSLSIPARLFRAARQDGCGTRVAIRRYLGAARGHALVCTHAALTAVRAKDLPPDLGGCALVVDEAHHVPAEGLSRVAKLWKERGGRLIFVTATPYRGDNLPVSLPGMVHVRRSLAAHMSEGFAPGTLASEVVALGHAGQRVTAAQLAGEVPPPAAYTDPTVRTIVDRWLSDGRPKTIVRVPPGRGRLVRRLADAFHHAGARVLDATGVEKGRKDRFLRALDAERELDHAGSLIDVVIGVQRVLEGTDWPHCSTVYCIGIPRALHVVVQLAGRAMRKKPTTYPAPYRDLARLTFFMPSAGGASLAGLSLEHSRHVLLTCAFMADHGTGQAWVVTAAVRRGLRRALAGQPEAVVEAAEALTDELTTPPTIRAEAQLALTAARAELVEQHERASVVAVLELAARVRPDLPREVLEQVAVEALASQPGEAGTQVTERLERGIATRLRVDPQVREAMKAAFTQVLTEFREATLARAAGLDALGHQVHRVTGGHMAEFARRLAAAHPVPLTIDGILAWADAQHAATGAWPTSESGAVHAVADETWKGVDSSLRLGHRGLPAGSSLARLLHERRGVPNRLEPRQLTEEGVLEMIMNHRAEHGAWPNRGSGPIAGTPFTWGAVDLALIHGRHGLNGGSSIAQLLQRHEGVRNARNLPPLTDAQVAEWAKAFETKHGRWPTRKDGQIDEAPAGETWARVAAAIEQGLRQLKARTSLPAFLTEVCGAPEPGSVRRALTVERILELARDYHRRTGDWPSAASRDPELEAAGDSWARIDRALIAGGRGLPRTTLVKLLAKHLHARNANRPARLDETTIWDWARAHLKRTGRFPSRTSGPVHGAPGETWGAIDGALKHRLRGLTRGETLRQFLDRMTRDAA